MAKKPDIKLEGGNVGANEARPPHAVVMWSDDNHIYVELPVKDNIPYITKFSFTEGGLSKALHVLRTARTNRPPSTITMSVIRSAEDHPSYLANPKIAERQHPLVKKPKPQFTEEQRANAREILRRKGLLNK